MPLLGPLFPLLAGIPGVPTGIPGPSERPVGLLFLVCFWPAMLAWPISVCLYLYISGRPGLGAPQGSPKKKRGG